MVFMITTCSAEFCRYITQRILMEQNKRVVNEFIFNCGILLVKKGNYFLSLSSEFERFVAIHFALRFLRTKLHTLKCEQHQVTI